MGKGGRISHPTQGWRDLVGELPRKPDDRNSPSRGNAVEGYTFDIWKTLANRVFRGGKRHRQREQMSPENARAIEDHIPALRRYARAMTGSRDGADDLVQDCLERAVACLAQFQSGTDLRAWLFAILHNLHCTRLRRRVRQGTQVPFEKCDYLLGQPARQGESLELRDLRRAILTLSPEHQRILLLAAVEGFSCLETAQILGVAIGTVKSRLSRAREKLRIAYVGEPAAEAPPSFTERAVPALR
jgi:RNA polymerase sigma-70 factor, ECF subfamily